MLEGELLLISVNILKIKTMSKDLEKSCDTCLFYVDAMPDVIICIGGKRVKEYGEMKTNCKNWVNTPENAKKELKKIKEKKK